MTNVSGIGESAGVNTDAATADQVALLIDFENLVRAVDEEDIDCEAVFRLADEYGRVLVANAYADWRMKDVNQYQTDLYGLGIELVHIKGQRRGALIKNAVDVKMAVDTVSLMSSLPHIDIYVIVSGDRDFIHVLKELRCHGKPVIGVSPNSAVSSDFSSLCDRFLRYEALTSSVEPTGARRASGRCGRSSTRDCGGKPRRSARFRGQDHAAPRAVVQFRRERIRLQELRELPGKDGRGRAGGSGSRDRKQGATCECTPLRRKRWSQPAETTARRRGWHGRRS